MADAWEPVRKPPAPPPCPPGERTGPPDFVGIGVQRCGTTRWFDLIASHADVVTPPGVRKELHFFDRFHAREPVPRAEDYHAYFPRPAGRLTGEWTPTYLTDVHTPRLLAAAAPDARLLVLLRDPIERYRSAIRRQERLAGRAGLSLHSLAPGDAFARGLYHAQLTRLLRHADRTRILLLQYERCVLEPRAELDRTLAFLGLSAAGSSPAIAQWPNRQPGKPDLGDSLTGELVEAYRADVQALAADWPEIDLTLWPHFAHLAP